MDFNPLAQPLNEIDQELTRLVGKEQAILSDLQWYERTDRRKLSDALTTVTAVVRSLIDTLQHVRAEIADTKRDADSVSSRLRTLFNPRNWFDEEQRQLRRKRRHLWKTIEEMEQEETDATQSWKIKRDRIADIETTLDRYDSFDLESQQTDLETTQSQLVSKREEQAEIAERKERVDKALEPQLQKMRGLASRKQKAESESRRARDLDNKLSSASNSYERSMLHQQCENLFGEGSPRKLIRRLEKEIPRIERDLKKAETRAREIGKRAARKIEKIVIDGNNLCYENGDQFIGLAVLEALVPNLKLQYSIVIVFDSAIRRMLRTDDGGVKKRLGEDAVVHVVATRQMADETVLELASNDDGTFVLSNDRFSEYDEKSVVRDERILRHEIVDGRIFVHDLGVRLIYNTGVET